MRNAVVSPKLLPRTSHISAANTRRRAAAVSQFFNHPAVLLVLGFVLTGVVGAVLTDRFQSAEKDRESRLAEDRAERELRFQVVQQVTDLAYARRALAGMVISSITRDAPLAEITARKAAYDQAYIAWNTQLQSILFKIRRAAQDRSESPFEVWFNQDLGNWFRLQDECLTQAVDVANKQRQEVDCGWRRPLREIGVRIQECSYAVTDALASYVYFDLSQEHESRRSQLQLSSMKIKRACPSPASFQQGSAPGADGPTKVE